MNMRKKSAISRLTSKELHKHPFVIPVITLLGLCFLTMVGGIFLSGRSANLGDSHVVQLSADGNRQVLPTTSTTVGQFLERAKITLHEGDVVEPAPDTPIDADDFRINVYRAQPVTIIDGEHRIQSLSAATTPRSIVAQAGLKVYPEDGVDKVVPDSDILKEQVIGTQIVITRSVPVNLNLYGTPVVVRTHVKTIRDLLAEKQVVLAAGDKVQPSLGTKLKPNMQVFITRFGIKIKTVKKPIPPNIKYVDDNSLSFGTTAIRQKGSPGQSLITYQVTLKNGKEISRTKIQEVRVEDPVPEIIARGKAIYIPADKSQLMATAGIRSSDYPYANYIISHESGWCPTKWQGQVGYCPPYYESIHSPDSGYGYGLCQATPGSKMSTAGSDWQTSAVTQLRWCSGYAGRYGGWAGAYNFWIGHGYW